MLCAAHAYIHLIPVFQAFFPCELLVIVRIYTAKEVPATACMSGHGVGFSSASVNMYIH